MNSLITAQRFFWFCALVGACAFLHAASDENLLKNGDFDEWTPEGGTNAWSLASSPADLPGCTLSRAEPDKKDKDGKAYLKMAVESSNIFSLTQYHAFEPGIKYRCRIRYKTIDFNGKTWLITETGNKKIDIERGPSGDLPVADQWAAAEIVFKVPAEYELSQFGIQVRVTGHGVVCVDFVSIEQLSN